MVVACVGGCGNRMGVKMGSDRSCGCGPERDGEAGRRADSLVAVGEWLHVGEVRDWILALGIGENLGFEMRWIQEIGGWAFRMSDRRPGAGRWLSWVGEKVWGDGELGWGNGEWGLGMMSWDGGMAAVRGIGNGKPELVVVGVGAKI
ncbi:hypothetical protein LINPERHAP1_LOCUS14235 [Linum perenne]